MATRGSGGAIRRRWLAFGLAAIMAAVFAAPTAAAPAPTEPSFENGESQPVFPTSSTSWINHDLYIETEVDSDNDGRKDLASSSQYSFSWGTNKRLSGVCRELRVTLNDGTLHTLRYKLTK